VGGVAPWNKPSLRTQMVTVHQPLRQHARILLLLAKAHTDAIAIHTRSPVKQQIGPNPRQVHPSGYCERERAVDAWIEIYQVVLAARITNELSWKRPLQPILRSKRPTPCSSSAFCGIVTAYELTPTRIGQIRIESWCCAQTSSPFQLTPETLQSDPGMYG
jgi:hypothetical protein